MLLRTACLTTIPLRIPLRAPALFTTRQTTEQPRGSVRITPDTHRRRRLSDELAPTPLNLAQCVHTDEWRVGLITHSHRHTRFFFNHYTYKYSPRGFCFPFYFYCEPNFFFFFFTNFETNIKAVLTAHPNIKLLQGSFLSFLIILHLFFLPFALILRSS